MSLSRSFPSNLTSHYVIFHWNDIKVTMQNTHGGWYELLLLSSFCEKNNMMKLFCKVLQTWLIMIDYESVTFNYMVLIFSLLFSLWVSRSHSLTPLRNIQYSNKSQISIYVSVCRRCFWSDVSGLFGTNRWGTDSLTGAGIWGLPLQPLATLAHLWPRTPGTRAHYTFTGNKSTKCTRFTRV